jgi:2-hydroxychromene-2-carboxylate isomerase
MSTLDFWFEFASTYSYPAAMRIGPLATARGVDVRWRPFLLGPVFKTQGWDTSPFNIYPVKGRYMWRDLERICTSLDLPWAPPTVFPQNTLLAARVALVALTQGWGEDFCRAVYAAEFGHGRDIGEPFAIADIVNALGHNPDAVIEQSRTEENKNALRAQTEEAMRLNISARRASSPRMANCSGATTAWRQRWTGRGDKPFSVHSRASGSPETTRTELGPPAFAGTNG